MTCEASFSLLRIFLGIGGASQNLPPERIRQKMNLRRRPGMGNFGAAIAELRENGIALLSVAEPNVDNTAAGRMAAGFHGVFSQYFSDALSEKMKDRSAASVGCQCPCGPLALGRTPRLWQ